MQLQFPKSDLSGPAVSPFILCANLLTAKVAFAQPVFSETEIAVHQQKIDVITSTAAQCLEAVYEDHRELFNTWKISKYYGDRNPNLATPALRCKQLKLYGTDLQKMLRQLGWKTLYWNPGWEGHAYRYSQVLKKRDYYRIPIDDMETLVGYQTTIPESFKAQSFFVGTAHASYHVFPSYIGKVIEAHSMRRLNSFENLEISAFNPLATGDGPRWTRTEQCRSGVIAIPPRSN